MSTEIPAAVPAGRSAAEPASTEGPPAADWRSDGLEEPAQAPGPLAALGPANATGREVQRMAAEGRERESERQDAGAAWLDLSGAARPGWLAAAGGLVAVTAAAVGGGGGGGAGSTAGSGGGTGVGTGDGAAGGVGPGGPAGGGGSAGGPDGLGTGTGVGTGPLPGTVPPEGASPAPSVDRPGSAHSGDSSGPVDIPVPLPQSRPDPVEAPTLWLAAMGAPVQGLPSSRDPVVTVGNLEPDGAWYYRVNGQDWVRGQGTDIPALVFTTQGPHRVEVFQSDLAGNEGPVTALEFVHDSEPPSPPDVSLKHNSGDATDAITDDATLVVGGVQPGDEWYFSVDGGDWQRGQGTEVPDAALGNDGTRTVAVVVRDATGNESAPTTVTVIRDTTPPSTAPVVSLEFDTGVEGDLVTREPLLLFSGLEPGARWSFSLDDGISWTDAPDAAETTFRDTTPFDRDGAWTVLARQIDAAGHVGTAVSRFDFTLDRTAPGNPSVALKEDTGLSQTDRVTRNGTVVVTGVDADETWAYRIDGGDWTTQALLEIPHTAFKDGTRLVEVAVWDVAGNRSGIVSLEFLLDTQVPGAPDLALPHHVAPVV